MRTPAGLGFEVVLGLLHLKTVVAVVCAGLGDGHSRDDLESWWK